MEICDLRLISLYHSLNNTLPRPFSTGSHSSVYIKGSLIFCCSFNAIIQNETKDAMPFEQNGWTTASLFNLMNYTFEPFEETSSLSFWNDGCAWTTTVEIWWTINIERIRRGWLPLARLTEPIFKEVSSNVRKIGDYFWYFGIRYVDGFVHSEAEDVVDEEWEYRCAQPLSDEVTGTVQRNGLQKFVSHHCHFFYGKNLSFHMALGLWTLLVCLILEYF